MLLETSTYRNLFDTKLLFRFQMNPGTLRELKTARVEIIDSRIYGGPCNYSIFYIGFPTNSEGARNAILSDAEMA